MYFGCVWSQNRLENAKLESVFLKIDLLGVAFFVLFLLDKSVEYVGGGFGVGF